MSTEELLDYSILFQCRINGELVEDEVTPDTTLLAFLRDSRRLTGTHMGCMTGHCGACTVLVDGSAVKSCITPLGSVQRASITTVEGLQHEDGTLNEIQQAFWDEAGLQCGYCAPGMLMIATELLQRHGQGECPGELEIRQALAGNLCRCTGYQSIVRAIETAAGRRSSNKTPTGTKS